MRLQVGTEKKSGRDSREEAHACCIVERGHQVEVEHTGVSSSVQEKADAGQLLAENGCMESCVSHLVLDGDVNVGAGQEDLECPGLAMQGSKHGRS